MWKTERLHWKNVKDEKPKMFVPVLGHLVDSGPYPAVLDCYITGNGKFFVPYLNCVWNIDWWADMPECTPAK